MKRSLLSRCGITTALALFTITLTSSCLAADPKASAGSTGSANDSATEASESGESTIPDITPGSDQLDASNLKPFRTTTSWGSMKVIESKLEGRKVLNVINQIESKSGVLVDHIVLDGKTLALIHRFSPFFAVGKDYLVASIDDLDLSGSLNPIGGGDPIVINTRLEQPVFEEATLGLVLASLPLDDGARGRLPRLAISGSTKTFATGWLNGEVVGRETIKGGDGRDYDCWVVKVTWDGVDFEETHWIADQPPYSIQKKSSFNGKSRGTSGFLTVEVGN